MGRAASDYFENFQGTTGIVHIFDAQTVLICHHILIWFTILLNGGGPLRTNFRYEPVLKKRCHTFDELSLSWQSF